MPTPSKPPVLPKSGFAMDPAALLVELAPALALLVPLPAMEPLEMAVAEFSALERLLESEDAALESEEPTEDAAEETEEAAEEAEDAREEAVEAPVEAAEEVAPLATLLAALVAGGGGRSGTACAAEEWKGRTGGALCGLEGLCGLHLCSGAAALEAGEGGLLELGVGAEAGDVASVGSDERPLQEGTERMRGTYRPEQPFAEAAWLMQVRMQGEMPEVEVGTAAELEALCAFEPARAARRARAERALKCMSLEERFTMEGRKCEGGQS